MATTTTSSFTNKTKLRHVRQTKNKITTTKKEAEKKKHTIENRKQSKAFINFQFLYDLWHNQWWGQFGIARQ